MMKMNELVSWFQLEYPKLVVKMKKSNHHLTEFDQELNYYDDYIPSTRLKNNIESLNPYHLESDVFTHVMMVCKQAENMPYEVQVAALLHDIGKPSTRKVNPKNGNVSFYNHDAVSAFMSLDILKRPELNLSKEQQVRIFNMIALHTQMFKLTEDQLSKIGDWQLLDNLELLRYADHCGRFTSIHSHQYEPRDLRCVRNEPRETTKEVVILCGLPASGKTSWKYENIDGGFYNVSRDKIIEDIGVGENYNEKWNNINQKQVDKQLQANFITAKAHDKVYVDMTHMSKKSRRRSLSHFGPEYKKKCVVFLPDLQEIKLRNEKRCGKIIDESVYDKMMRSFYPPTYEMFDEIEYII
jgi:putative nucleotidyltransferase with HDIG domain